MKNLLVVTLVSLAALVGCAYSIADIDVSKSEPSCVRQCSTTYSDCVSGGNQIYDPNSTSPSEACLLFLSKRFNALRPSYI